MNDQLAVMLQRFIVITLVTYSTGLLVACSDAIRSNTSNQLNPSPNRPSNPENTLQLQFPTPPSAEMKNELKREKYQLQHQFQPSDRKSKGEQQSKTQ